MNAKSMPSHRSVMDYWQREINKIPAEKLQNDSFLWKLVSINFEDAKCWACEFYPVTCSDPRNFKFLQRCHIVPKMLGGSYDPSNIVLLCKGCHEESPDVSHPIWMKKWIAQKSSWWVMQADRAKNNLTEKEMEFMVNHLSHFRKYMKQNMGCHLANSGSKSGKSRLSWTTISLIKGFYPWGEKDTHSNWNQQPLFDGDT
jgi:hypothetical protein